MSVADNTELDGLETGSLSHSPREDRARKVFSWQALVCGSPFTAVVRYDNMNVMDGNEWRMAETRKARPVSWVKAAFNEFGKFPEGVRSICVAALTIAAECGKADIAKPMQGMWSGILEIALPFKGDAFRVVYSVQLSRKSGCLHAFQKKSTKGIKTLCARFT